MVTESKSVVAWGGGSTAGMHKVTFGDGGDMLHLIVVVVTQAYCAFVEVHHTVFFTQVYFLICKLYFSKGFFMVKPFVTFYLFFPPNSDIVYSSSQYTVEFCLVFSYSFLHLSFDSFTKL